MTVPRFVYLYPNALLRLFWLCTFGVFNAEQRRRIADLGREVPWFQAARPFSLSCAEMPLDEAMGYPEEIILQHPSCAFGNVSLTELAVLSRLVEKFQPCKLFEFGTFDGRSTLNLISHAAKSAHIYTLDLPPDMAHATQFPVLASEIQYIQKSRSGEKFLQSPFASCITQLYGDSATFDFSPYRGQMDFIFIDASHAYENVRSDTLNALEIISSSGGLIIWHDYTAYWQGVVRALNEFFKSDPRFAALKVVEGTTLAVLKI